MRRIVVSTFVSLDGVMQAPGGPPEDPTGGFEYGGWVAGAFDEAAGEALGAIFGKPFDLLLGRKTYDIFAAHWPYQPAEDEIGGVFNSTAKYVVSRGAPKLTWANSRLIDITGLKALKSGDGPDLLVQGSSDLLQTLWREGLVDELNVFTFPVVLGKGKRLFESGAAAAGLKLIASKGYAGGVVVSTYQPDGPVKIGDFTQTEPSAAELERRARLT